MAEQRSRAYPAIPINDAIAKLKELHKNLGDSKSYHRDSFASGLNYKSATNGAFLRTLAALNQYGLVVKDGNDYKLTDLSRQILLPTTETAEGEAIKKAALTPKVFKEIFDRYNGQQLPALLPNILVNDFGILDGAKNKVVSIFRKTMESVGFLSGNMLGQSDDTRESQEDENEFLPTDHNTSVTTTMNRSEVSSNTQPQSEMNKFEIVLREGARAGIYAPYGLTSDEKNKLKSLIDLM